MGRCGRGQHEQHGFDLFAASHDLCQGVAVRKGSHKSLSMSGADPCLPFWRLKAHRVTPWKPIWVPQRAARRCT